MISDHDLIMVCLVGLAFTLSKQPKKMAVGLCVAALILIVAGDYFLTGVTFYWLAFGVELSTAYILWGLSHDIRARHDRMYYRALSAFLACSCVVTGLYIYDVGAYSAHPYYAATSSYLGLFHALFMVGFSDTFIQSGVVRKGVALIDSAVSRLGVSA